MAISEISEFGRKLFSVASTWTAVEQHDNVAENRRIDRRAVFPAELLFKLVEIPLASIEIDKFELLTLFS